MKMTMHLTRLLLPLLVLGSLLMSHATPTPSAEESDLAAGLRLPLRIKSLSHVGHNAYIVDGAFSLGDPSTQVFSLQISLSTSRMFQLDFLSFLFFF
ncbi:MAG: hypothetical protein Q8P67_11075, partial [archaeon]|nr:hypothetical protein [archaeon]